MLQTAIRSFNGRYLDKGSGVMVSGRLGAALVTGGGSGIGAAVVNHLAARGWAVAVADVNLDAAKRTAEMARQTDQRILALELDVREKESCSRCVDACSQAFGFINGLVNCAGMNIRREALALQTAEWDSVLEVNLRGTFLMCQSVGARMVAEGRGSIVNLASMYAHIGGMNVGAYAASKGGVALLTRSLALEWGRRGVRVNAVSPGWIKTPLTERVFAQAAYRKRIVSRTALGRLGAPDDVAEVVSFFLSEAARFVTGVVLPVDGGFLSGDSGLVPSRSI